MALYLDQIDTELLKGKRIAYYPGSFDPLHLGHTTVVNTVLDKGLADFVLVYALPDSSSSKGRTPFKTRFLMLETQYKDHPKVLITSLSPVNMQKILAPMFDRIQFSVVQGSDNVNQYVNSDQYDSVWMKAIPLKGTIHENTSTGAIMAIPATQVIAFNRAGEDLSYVGQTYKERPLTILTTPINAELSSTQARQAVQRQQDLKGILPQGVIEIIQENQLYRN